eukprot:jgi/Botrbrau1/10960/Bobra.0383s0014.1
MRNPDSLRGNEVPPTLQMEVDVHLLLADSAAALQPVLSSLVGWENAVPEDLEVSQISGAMTNLVYRCRLKRTRKHVLARIFGGGNVLFNRSTEQAIFGALGEAGIGPKLLASFGNGRLEEFLFDGSMSPEAMRSGRMAVCIAAAMAAFHYTRLTSLQVPEQAILWDRCRNWADRVASLYSPDELQELGLSSVLQEIDALERALVGRHPNWLGFCHNDLQYGNMMVHAAHPSSLHLDSLTSVTLPSIEAKLASSADFHDWGARSRRSVRCESGQIHGPRGASPDSIRGISPSRRMKRGESYCSDEHYFDSFYDGAASGNCLPEDPQEEGLVNGGGEQRTNISQATSSAGSPSPPPSAFLDAARQPFRASSVLSLDAESDAAGAAGPLSVRFIDYEYAGINHVAFDMANHWMEYAADYHGEHPHLMDYSKLPSEAHQAKFVRSYVRAALMLKANKDLLHLLPGYSLTEDAGLMQQLARGTSAREFSSAESLKGGTTGNLADLVQAASDCGFEEAVRQLLEASQDYMIMSHLVWGLWGLIQLKVSDVADFDFYSYAVQRLQQYHALKARVLGSR